MGAWRALLLLWNKTDSGCEVRRRKHFLGKVPKLDRGRVMCYKAMSKESTVACIHPPPYQKPNNWEPKSPSNIWTRSQPSQLHKEGYVAVSSPEVKQKDWAQCNTFLLLCLPSVIMRPIRDWAGTMFWSQLIYPHFTSLQFTVYKAI